MEKTLHIDRTATLPLIFPDSRTGFRRPGRPIPPNGAAPAHGKRKAALYATCFVDYNAPQTAVAARRCWPKQGVETQLAYPGVLRHAPA